MTEQQILKKFEELGYRYDKCMDGCQFINDTTKEVIAIDKKRYAKCDMSANWTSFITLQEHQLLHELFTVWGWFDE